ncbi:hypothetical protein [Streptomyces griseoluteus]|uniref:hypothetical protein n=1 Tax=Streptomyces griseoluteus TaxID=29306 RepID=UPI003811BA45
MALLAILLTAVQYWQQTKREARQRHEQSVRDEAQAEASQIATRQAEAQERRAYAMEQTLAELVRALEQSRQLNGEPLPPGNGGGEGSVEWQLRHRKGQAYVLRNTGSVVATGVHVNVGEHPRGLTRSLPEDAVVPPHEAVEFLLIGAWGAPVPHSIRVKWDNGEQTLAVPEP